MLYLPYGLVTSAFGYYIITFNGINGLGSASDIDCDLYIYIHIAAFTAFTTCAQYTCLDPIGLFSGRMFHVICLHIRLIIDCY